MKADTGLNTGQLIKAYAPVSLGALSARHAGKSLVLALSLAGSAQAQIIDDPVAYWDFQEAAGMLENRVMPGPYHNAAVLKGLPASGVLPGEAGIAGNALLLDGASALRLPYHQDNLGQSFTLALWYWQATNDTRQAVYQSQDNWDVTYEATGNNSVFASYIGQVWAGTLTTGLKEWVHLAHVFSTVSGTTTLSVYTNGVLAQTKTASAATVFKTYQIRALNVGASRSGDRLFKGMLDELALYGRALSADEVQALHLRGLAGQGLSVTPAAWPRIELNGLRAFSLNMDAAAPAGVYQNGWLRDDIQAPPDNQLLPEQAARLDDTAGHADGPFHAQAVPPKLRVPIEAAGLGQVTQGDFTIEAFFRSRENDRGILIGCFAADYSLSALNLELQNANDGVRLYVQPSLAGRTIVDLKVASGTNIRDGAWHHLAGVRRDGKMVVHVDGVQVGETNDTAGAFTLTSPYFYLKGDSRSDVTVFNGDLENARLWTRGLSSNEVASLAAGSLPGEGLVATNDMLAEYVGAYSPYNATYAAPKYRTALVPPLTHVTRGEFSVESWFRTTNAARGVLIGCYTNNTAVGCFNLELYTKDNVRLYVQPGSGSGFSITDLISSEAAFDIHDGQWHHAAGVVRGGSAYVYVDGQPAGTKAYASGTFTPNGIGGLFIGRDGRSGVGVPFNGELENTRLWRRALTDGEVASLATNALPGDPSVAVEGLVAEYDYHFPTNSLRNAGYAGARFARTFITGTNTLSLVFSGVPPHKEIGLGALVSQLDSLEPSTSSDSFALLVDGAEVLYARLGSGTAASPAIVSLRLMGQAADTQLLADCQTFGGENLFYCGGTADFDEHVYDLSQLDALQRIPHAGSTLTLEIVGLQDQQGGDESFGIDQIELTVPPLLGTIIMVN